MCARCNALSGSVRAVEMPPHYRSAETRCNALSASVSAVGVRTYADALVKVLARLPP